MKNWMAAVRVVQAPSLREYIRLYRAALRFQRAYNRATSEQQERMLAFLASCEGVKISRRADR